MGEIVSTLRKNKLRTFLTGFSIAWGIFMLIILLGSGNGVRNGVEKQMSSINSNAFRIYGGTASLPYEGLPVGREIYLDENAYQFLRHSVPGITNISPSKSIYDKTISHGEEYVQEEVESGTPGTQIIFNLEINDRNGRFINEADLRECRKVIVLNEKHRKALFRDEDPIGKYVLIDGLAFKVIGIYSSSGNSRWDTSSYMPITTMSLLYSRDRTYWNIAFTVDGISTVEQSEAFTDMLRGKLSRVLRFDPKDPPALYVSSMIENVVQSRKVFRMLNAFLAMIGLASMIAGIVGVGNIMYVTVKERTREIGIRKAIGASPGSIIRLVILEAVFITTAAGYIGILLGIGTLKGAGRMLASSDTEALSILQNPSVDLWTVFGATLLLVAAGVVAGLIPAWKAAKIKPIEAMRAEQ